MFSVCCVSQPPLCVHVRFLSVFVFFVHLCHISRGPLFCCVSSSFILVSVALRVSLRFAFLSRLVKCLQLCVPPARTPLLTFCINDLSLPRSCAPPAVSSQHLEFVFCFLDQCELSVDSAINTHFMFSSVCLIRNIKQHSARPTVTQKTIVPFAAGSGFQVLLAGMKQLNHTSV